MKRKGITRRLLGYLRPHAFETVLSFLLAAGQVALSLCVPVITGRAVDLMLSAGNVDFRGIFRLLAILAGAVLTAALLQWCMGALNNRIVAGVQKSVRRDAFEHIQKVPLSYIDSKPSGEFVSRIMSDADRLSDGLLLGASQLFSGVATILGTLAFMLTIDPLLTLVVAVLSPLSFLVARFVSTRTFSLFGKQSAIRGELTAFTDEALGGIRTLKAFGREEPSAKRFSEINDRLADSSKRATFFSSLTNPSTRFMYALIYAGVAAAGCFMLLDARLTVGGLTAFLMYSSQYTRPFNDITSVITELQSSYAGAQRIFEINDSPVPDEPSAELPVLSGAIGFEDVSFSYTPERPLIEDLSLSVEPGQRVAVVGPTGCGKTTLINLIMRFYDPVSGSITADGKKVDGYSRASLRRSCGMVLQETWLKSATVAENIAYGRPGATREEIVAAAKSAHADSFITRLPDGYDTMLGEDGGSLSAGQKQLLCIARVMLRMPPVLILDEATSSIDTVTELRIQRAFDEMMRGRTSFIVAHRLSTVRNADVILVMRDGKIIERGSYDELVSLGGFFAGLIASSGK